MVKTLKEVFTILSENMEYLRKKFKVEKIGVFGSYSREEMSSESDIDILVEFKEPIGLFNFIKLENYISEILSIKVDLVTNNALRPEIKDTILKDLVYSDA